MSIAIVVDSNSGVTQKEAKKLGIYVLPMPFMIDGKVYYEDIDLTHDEFYEKMKAGADITTSQPSPNEVMELWDSLLKKYDELVYIPMSSGLSGSCQTAMMLSGEYGGRVQVVDNQRISVTQRQSALDAVGLGAKGCAAGEIKAILEHTRSSSIIYITVDTLKYLKKGGRITPAAAALGTLLKIKPVLTIDGGKLDAFSKARTMKQARIAMLTALAHDLRERLGDEGGEHTCLQIAHACNGEAARELEETVQKMYPSAPVFSAPLSLSIGCHIGPGALAVACTGMLKELE